MNKKTEDLEYRPSTDDFVIANNKSFENINPLIVADVFGLEQGAIKKVMFSDGGSRLLVCDGIEATLRASWRKPEKHELIVWRLKSLLKGLDGYPDDALFFFENGWRDSPELKDEDYKTLCAMLMHFKDKIDEECDSYTSARAFLKDLVELYLKHGMHAENSPHWDELENNDV